MKGKETEVMATDRILRMPEVSEMTTLAEQTLYSMRAKGTGPRSFSSAVASPTASPPSLSGLPSKSRRRKPG